MTISDSHGLNTRPQLSRLLELRAWLMRGGGTACALAERLEVSERTIRRDLEFVRDRLDWPVQFARAERRWKLVGSANTLPLVPLNEQELIAVMVAGRALALYRGTSFEPALASAFRKILGMLDSDRQVAAIETLPVFELDPVREFDSETWGLLFTACRDRRQLEMTYHTFGSGEINTRRIDPYCLHNHDGDWYLIGHCHLRRGIRHFAVGERIRAVRETGESFVIDPGFNLRDYLSTGFGVFKGGEPEDVVLHFNADQARYMRERVWSPSEVKEDQPDGSLVMRMRVPVNIGLVRFVLQQGAAVRVVAPERLREQVAAELRLAAEAYR